MCTYLFVNSVTTHTLLAELVLLWKVISEVIKSQSLLGKDRCPDHLQLCLLGVLKIRVNYKRVI